jgi:glutamyl-tRNA reductase
MIIAIGLNHKTAPLAVREMLAFDATQTLSMLKALRQRFPQGEFVLLSTCNRVELYCAGSHDQAPTAEQLSGLLARSRGTGHTSFQPHLYIHSNEDAVRHLLTVTAGLDSMVVGETEILGQVKESYRVAREAGATGQILNRLFHLAIATGKKVHSQTSLSANRASVPGLAAGLVGRCVPDVAARVLVIGAGEMGELLVRLLQQAGYVNVTVINRSSQRGAGVAASYGVSAAPWDSLGEHLASCDVAISSAASTEHIVNAREMELVASRRDKDLLVVDIGVPRNFDPAIARLPGIRLFSIDDLSPLLCEQPALRSEEIAASFDLIYKTSADFMRWFASRELGPLIGAMQERFRMIAAEELKRILADHINTSTREELESVIFRIVGQISHTVICHVSTVAQEHGPDHAARFIEDVLAHAEEVYADPARIKEFVK